MEKRAEAVEEHGYGKLRLRSSLPSQRLKATIDHVTRCGWHDCNDRYMIVREHSEFLPEDYLIVLTTGGEGVATVGSERYRLTPGTVMIFPRGMYHTYGVAKGGRWIFYWIHAYGTHCGTLLDYILRECGRLIETANTEQLIGLMEQLIVTEKRYSEYEAFAARILSDLLLLLIEEQEQPRTEVGGRSRTAIEVAQYIEEHSGEPIRIEEISAQMYLSTEHVIRIFKAETGMTPYQYLKQVRMKRACIYLEESGMTVEEITRTIGYQSASSFISQFKSRFGVTPREYRMRHKTQRTDTGHTQEEGKKHDY